MKWSSSDLLYLLQLVTIAAFLLPVIWWLYRRESSWMQFLVHTMNIALRKLPLEAILFSNNNSSMKLPFILVICSVGYNTHKGGCGNCGWEIFWGYLRHHPTVIIVLDITWLLWSTQVGFRDVVFVRCVIK